MIIITSYFSTGCRKLVVDPLPWMYLSYVEDYSLYPVFGSVGSV